MAAARFERAGDRDPASGGGDIPSSSAPADELRRTIDRYNDAWNAHVLDAIVALHAPNMVFENHTGGERAAGGAVREHIGRIFENWPDISFRVRRLHLCEGLVVSEWTATATQRGTGRRLEWDGVDLLHFHDGLIARKDFYSGSARPRVLTE